MAMIEKTHLSCGSTEGKLEQLPKMHICILPVNKQCLFPKITALNGYYRQYYETSERLHYGDMENAFLDKSGNADTNCFIDGLLQQQNHIKYSHKRYMMRLVIN